MTKYSKVKTVEDVKSLLKHYLVGVEVKDLTTGLVSHCSSYVALALFNQCEYVSHRHSEFGDGEVLELKVRSTENEVANKYLVCEYASVSEFLSSFKKKHLIDEIYRVLPTQIAYIGRGSEFLAKHSGSVKVYSTYDGKVAVMLKDDMIWEYLNGK
jgi:hypothetical protein